MEATRPSGPHNAGEFNPTKLATAALSAANAARLAASGVLKLTAGTALDLTGAWAAPGTLLVAWGGWNLRSASVALDKSFLFANQAVSENFSDASLRNFAGLLPMGQYYDDPGEPGPIDMSSKNAHQLWGGRRDWDTFAMSGIALWIVVAILSAFCVLAPAYAVRAIRRGESFWKILKTWVINVIDALTGIG